MGRGWAVRQEAHKHMIHQVGVKHMAEGHLSEGDGLEVREGVREGLSALAQ